QMFVEEYLIDLNATQAAIRAGFSVKNAGKIGPELLGKTRIAEAIERELALRSRRTGIRQDSVLYELSIIGNSDIRHYFIDDQGNVSLAQDAPEEAMRAIAGLRKKTTHITTKSGDFHTIHETELKLWNKNHALELFGKHLGMFTDKLALTDPTGKKPYAG